MQGWEDPSAETPCPRALPEPLTQQVGWKCLSLTEMAMWVSSAALTPSPRLLDLISSSHCRATVTGKGASKAAKSPTQAIMLGLCRRLTSPSDFTPTTLPFSMMMSSTGLFSM